MSEAAVEEPSDETLEELRLERELLVEENARLREAYARTKRTTYRTTAIGLAAIGLVAVVGGLVLPSAREVLFALGATGLFGAVLTWFVTPERFVAADVGRSTYAAMAGTLEALVDELGLSDDRHYVPTGADAVRLYVPQTATEEPPPDEALSDTLVVTETARGLAVEPTGARLFDVLAPAGGDLAATPAELAPQLTEALVEQFELVDSADPDLDPDGGRLTVAVGDSAYGPIDRFDHPVASVLATGLARGLDAPVELEVTAEVNGGRVTCRWDA